MCAASALRNIARVYFNTALIFGFTRAVTYNYENKKEYFNSKIYRYEQKDMLLVDNIANVIVKTFAALIFLPHMLHEDLTKLECRTRGKSFEEYSKR